MKKHFLLTALAVLTLSQTAFAISEEPIYLDPNTNTLFGGANKKEVYALDNYAESIKSVGANVDVITREDLQKQHNPSLTDVLNYVGSVSTNNANGSDGSVTSVRIRGTDRVRITIDGIRADKPSSTSGGAESHLFLTDDLERIEVIKGPQGNVLGTNASGGVIAAQTRRGRGPLSMELESGMGNYSTFKERFAIMGGDQKKDFYSAITWYKTDGGMWTSDVGRIFNDRYSNLNVVTNLGLRMLDNKAELREIFRFSNASKGLGYAYTNLYQDPNNLATNLDIMNVLTFKHAPTKSYDYDAKFGLYHNRYNYYILPDDVSYDTYSNSAYQSTRLNFMTQHNVKYRDWNTFTLGYNLESEFLDGGDNIGTYNPSYYSGSTIQNDVFVNDVINIKDILFIRGGARLISNSQFGTYVTPNASAALVLPTFKLQGAKTKFRASWGQNVNIPTLYQRYGMLMSPWGSMYPNPNLSAEKYQSWDVGVEQSFCDDKLKFEFGYFNSNYKDYIAYNYLAPGSWDGHYVNIDSASIQGYEAKATWEPNEKFKLVFSYTYTDSQDKATGRDLPGTPRNRFTGMAYWTPIERFSMYFGIETGSPRRMSSSQYTDNNIAPSYVDAKIGASLRLFSYKGLDVYLKGNIYNLFNQNICMYKSNGTYFYAPGIHFTAGIFMKYNLPEKEKV